MLLLLLLLLLFLYLSREEKQIWPTESLQINIQSCQERSSKQSRHIVTEQSPFSLTLAPQTGHQSVIIKITTIIEQSLHAILRHRLTSCLHKSMYYMSPDPLLALALGTGRLRQTTLLAAQYLFLDPLLSILINRL